MSVLDGILGCWSPSLGVTGVRLLDRSGYSNHGTLTNMDPPNDWVTTSIGRVLDFDGTNDYVAIGSPSMLSGSFAQMTKNLWVLVRQTAAQKYLFADFNAGGTTSRLSISHDTKFKAFQNTAKALTGTTTLMTNRWYMVTVTRNDGTGAGGTGSMILYVNGIAEASTTYSYTSPALQASGEQLARSNAMYGDHPNAQIGEASMWQRDLSPVEVSLLFKARNGWIGRELTGVNRRRRFGKSPVNRRRRFLLGAAS